MSNNGGQPINKRINTMTAQNEENLFAYEVPDETLETAAGTAKEQANFTLGACTGLSECPG